MTYESAARDLNASGFLLLASEIETFVTIVEIVTVGLVLTSLRNTWHLLVAVGNVAVDSDGTRP